MSLISLSDRIGKKTYPRRLFSCNECGVRTFKIHETDGNIMVECSNCENLIDMEDIFHPDGGGA